MSPTGHCDLEGGGYSIAPRTSRLIIVENLEVEFLMTGAGFVSLLNYKEVEYGAGAERTACQGWLE
jgi:hypothetical protein